MPRPGLHSEHGSAHADDCDMRKGAVESPSGPGNVNAAWALDDEGLPQDEVAIAQDRLGAMVDQTQG
jgi:hypothetical protein